MKILAVIPSEPISQYLLKGHSKERLKDYYNPAGFFEKVYLLSPREENNPNLIGMEVIRTEPHELPRRIKDLNIDIVRAYGGYWAGNMACNYKVSNVPVVVSVHDARLSRLYDSIRKADIVLCMSKIVKDNVLKKFPNESNIWVIPNRVDFNVMRQRFPKDEELNYKYPYKYKIIHVGRKVIEKNLDTVIKAMAFLDQDYGLIAVGPGSNANYIKLAKDNGVSSRCHFIGALNQEELSRHYSWADCMCTPSRSEGFGLVFIEALACGAAVITSDIAPMNEYIENNKNGLLVKDYENPSDLADIIRKACTDKNLKMFLKKNARKSVEKFEKSRIDMLEASFYQKILEMKNDGKFAIPPYRQAIFNLENAIKRSLPSDLKSKVRELFFIK